MFDIVVVGSGPSAYGFLKGLEKNQNMKNKKIAILYPSEYSKTTKKREIKDISPKFLQEKNLLSLSYYLDTFGDVIENNFSHIGIHGIGGMARIWGGSIGFFDEKSILRNGFDCREFNNCYNELEKFLPLKHQIKISDRIKNLFGSYDKGRFLVDYPNLIVKDNCDNCNQCLIGCEKDSVWYPRSTDFKEINLNITIFDGCYATDILKNKVIFLKDGKADQINAKLIVLAGGAMQNYKLLAKIKPLNNKKASILTTPAVAFAFFNFKRNINKDFFGMGNATFQIKDEDKTLLYGNFYDGYSLSISKGKVFSSNSIKDSIFKTVSKYMVAGAGFMSSDCSNSYINLENNKYLIGGEFTPFYFKNLKYIQNRLKKFTKKTSSIYAYFKTVRLGADIHYGGGVPKELYVKDLIKDGIVKDVNYVKVIGGSTFSYLSPVSPTLSYIANSYRIGKNLKGLV